MNNRPTYTITRPQHDCAHLINAPSMRAAATGWYDRTEDERPIDGERVLVSGPNGQRQVYELRWVVRGYERLVAHPVEGEFAHV